MIPHLLSAILLNNQEIKTENIQEINISSDILYTGIPIESGKCGSPYGNMSIFVDTTLEYNEGIRAIHYKTLKNSPRVDNVIVTIYLDNEKDKFI